MLLLRHRPRSEKEVTERLRSRGVPQPEIDRLIARARSTGHIDDRLFAKWWIQARIERRPLARRAMERELLDLGVEEATVRQALQSLYPSGMEEENARRLALDRHGRLRGLDVETRKRRIAGYLARRGFSTGLAWEIARDLEEAVCDE